MARGGDKSGSGSGSGSRSKRSSVERVQDRVAMIRLMRRGWTQSQIAEFLELTHSQVALEWKEALRQVRGEEDEDAADLVALKLEEYAEIKREAWSAWEKSKLDAQRRIEEVVQDEQDCSVCDGTGKSVKGDPCYKCKGEGHLEELKFISLTTIGQSGNPKYLQVVLDCLHAERELLALNPSKKVDAKVEVINWDVLTQDIPDGPVPDRIEEEIARVLSYNGAVAAAEARGKNGDDGDEHIIDFRDTKR